MGWSPALLTRDRTAETGDCSPDRPDGRGGPRFPRQDTRPGLVSERREREVGAERREGGARARDW